MNPCVDVSSVSINRLLARQLRDWPLAAENYKKLKQVQVHLFDMGECSVKVQFTPSRALSSGAKVDMKSILGRKCFLCAENLPKEQEWLSFKPGYRILCNPYPIFPEHFTIAAASHEPQEIAGRFSDFLILARLLDQHTLFYNGPRSGASAPDHAHFQAVTRGVMPLDNEIPEYVKDQTRLILRQDEGELYLLSGYLRNGFVIRSVNKEVTEALFHLVYQSLDLKPGETEPGMNLFGFYDASGWTIVVIPRRKHRPRQFEATGEEHLLVSPGAADMGGLFIAAREEDFHKLSAEVLQDIYQQVCYSNEEVGRISENIRVNWRKRLK